MGKTIKKIAASFLPSLGGVGGGLVLSLFLLMLFACSNGHYTHKAAQKAAVKYYTMLIKGNYKGFVDGYAGSEDLPDSYRKEMGDLMKQFMADGEMPNLRKVTALSDSLGEDSTAYVMLQLQYGDSIFEQIEMPLVLTKKGWRMK